MKSDRIIMLILALLCLSLLVVPVRAAEEDGAPEEPIIDIDELERAAEDSGSDVDYGIGLDEGIEALLDTGSREIHGIVRRAARSGVLLLAILLLVGLADAVREGVGQRGGLAVTLAGALAVAAVAAVETA